MSSLIHKDLQQQRCSLIHFVENKRPQGSSNNAVTIVFDGKSGIISRTESSSVKVVFSKDESADQKIKKIVNDSRNTKNIVVVTDDRAIQFAVRACGAKILKVKSFLSGTKSVSKKCPNVQDNPKQKEPTKTISHSLKARITSELEEIWLSTKRESTKKKNN